MKNARHGVHASVVLIVKLNGDRSVITGRIRRSRGGNSRRRFCLRYSGGSSQL
jgi:hypothetical protein